MRVKLSPEYEPELFMGPEAFEDYIAPDDRYFGVPVDYFNIGENNVTLQKEVTGEIEWVVKQICGERVNLVVPAQSITVDGEQINIQPGFTGGLIKSKHVVAISPNNATTSTTAEAGETAG